MNAQHAAVVAFSFMLAGIVQAQCPPQRLDSPSDFGRAFGTALAANERHLIVGDWRDHTLCGDPFCANGYAWAYERDTAGQWAFAQRLEPADLGWSAGFGSSVALDGDRVLITRTLGGDCGGVPYTFEFDGEQWVETGRLCPLPLQVGRASNVALLGDLALVGGSSNVLVYFLDDQGWSITHLLYNPDGTGDPSAFGVAFDLDDDWVVIGAATERVTATFGGAAYVYRRLTEGQLELAQKLVAPDVLNGPQFGISIAIDGDTLAVGGYISDREFDEQGAVYMFTLVDGQWELQQELTHAMPERFDRFGSSLDLKGDRLLVAANSDSTPTSRGAAYLFLRGVDGNWRQTADVLPDQYVAQYGYEVTLLEEAAIVGGGNSVHSFDLSCILCKPDLDGDGTLTIFDFLTFLNLFQDGDALADFDGDGELTIFDFLAFQTAFDAGCE